jgi:hypothetical protein
VGVHVHAAEIDTAGTAKQPDGAVAEPAQMGFEDAAVEARALIKDVRPFTIDLLQEAAQRAVGRHKSFEEAAGGGGGK